MAPNHEGHRGQQHAADRHRADVEGDARRAGGELGDDLGREGQEHHGERPGQVEHQQRAVEGRDVFEDRVMGEPEAGDHGEAQCECPEPVEVVAQELADLHPRLSGLRHGVDQRQNKQGDGNGRHGIREEDDSVEASRRWHGFSIARHWCCGQDLVVATRD